jgi:hypothetical protein
MNEIGAANGIRSTIPDPVLHAGRGACPASARVALDQCIAEVVEHQLPHLHDGRTDA